MKAVMISIQPKMCALIANGEKTIEVRKTRPKISVPFKCYIYCTKIKDKKKYSDEFDIPTNTRRWCGNGKVIGEFVCDKITYITADIINGTKHLGNTFGLNTCLTYGELFDYIYRGKGRENCGRAWHITDLKIYDEPKELSEFSMYGFKHLLDSSCCSNYSCKFYIPSNNYIPPECKKNRNCVITKPPQSWCYCEELEENEND